jgi:hypothetical protein
MKIDVEQLTNQNQIYPISSRFAIYINLRSKFNIQDKSSVVFVSFQEFTCIVIFQEFQRFRK